MSEIDLFINKNLITDFMSDRFINVSDCRVKWPLGKWMSLLKVYNKTLLAKLYISSVLSVIIISTFCFLF